MSESLEALRNEMFETMQRMRQRRSTPPLPPGITRGEINALGSDCHNMTTRPPRLGEAIQVIQKSVECDVWREFQRNLPDLSGKGERL